MPSVKSTARNVKDIFSDYRLNKSIVIPDLQRKYIWKSKQKGLLVDSILRGYDIPKFYFLLNDVGNYEVIDGQQRIETVCCFMENGFTTPNDMLLIDNEDLSNLLYSELSREHQRTFDVTNLDIKVLIDYSESDKEEAFLRLQAGTPLSPAEKRHAIKGQLRDIICDIAQTHPIFGPDTSKFKMDRYQDEEMVAKCIYLFLNNNLCDLNASRLQKMYKKNREFNSKHSVIVRLKWALNFLMTAMGTKDGFSGFKKNELISLVFLVNYFNEHYVIKDQQEDFAISFMEFEDNRIKNNKLPDNERDVGLERYSRSIREQSSKNLKWRHTFLEEFFLRELELKPKDPVRSYTSEEHYHIFRRDNGKCKLCGKGFNFKDTVVDHIVPHAKGGFTSLDNGQLTCKFCNLSKGSKQIKDIKYEEKNELTDQTLLTSEMGKINLK